MLVLVKCVKFQKLSEIWGPFPLKFWVQKDENLELISDRQLPDLTANNFRIEQHVVNCRQKYTEN